MMKMILILLMMALFGLQYKLWFGDNGVLQARMLTQKCAQLEKDNHQLQSRNQAIESNIMGLKSGDQALEEQARTELGMVKQGEEYYQFVN